MSSFSQFPEELVERILLHAVVAPSAPHPRASWHSHSQQGKELQTRGRTAPLLVCRAFHRIALPLFYHTLVVHSPHQSASLLEALRTQPHLARSVRVIALPNPSACDAEVLKCCQISSIGRDAAELRRRRRGTRRGGTYLSRAAPRAMLDALADTVSACAQLQSTTFTFPLSSDPALASLSAALSTAPALRTLRTPLPALWTTAYVEVAANPSIERVCLGGEESATYSPVSAVECPPWSAVECESSASPKCAAKEGKGPTQVRPFERRFTSPSPSPYQRAPRPILPTALFISAARPHARLTELIKAGTDIAVGWRGRAATLDTKRHDPDTLYTSAPGSRHNYFPSILGPIFPFASTSNFSPTDSHSPSYTRPTFTFMHHHILAPPRLARTSHSGLRIPYIVHHTL
ncbi:hypothetical protein K438DRAFT_1965793 [Mycena galopus ATCC 62051]|nr:hypothetical protein K438DRAFT_1965793 [Mycena galopus ATCC 62051]